MIGDLLNRLNFSGGNRELHAGDPEQSMGSTEKMVNLLNMSLKNMKNVNDGLLRTIAIIGNQDQGL